MLTCLVQFNSSSNVIPRFLASYTLTEILFSIIKCIQLNIFYFMNYVSARAVCDKKSILKRSLTRFEFLTVCQRALSVIAGGRIAECILFPGLLAQSEMQTTPFRI